MPVTGAISPRAIRRLNWARIDQDIATLAHKLREAGAEGEGWRGIVAITRGGIVPAGLLCRPLGVMRVETLGIRTYHGLSRGEAEIVKPLSAEPGGALADRGAGWLVVDDLIDTGATIELARGFLPLATFATLYAKRRAQDLVDFFVEQIDPDDWVDFPWDPSGPTAPPAGSEHG